MTLSDAAIDALWHVAAARAVPATCLVRDFARAAVAAADAGRARVLEVEVERLQREVGGLRVDAETSRLMLKTYGLHLDGKDSELATRNADADRYRWLRERPLDSICKGGLFVGMTPSNVVINGDDLDAAIDASIAAEQKGGA